MAGSTSSFEGQSNVESNSNPTTIKHQYRLLLPVALVSVIAVAMSLAALELLGQVVG